MLTGDRKTRLEWRSRCKSTPEKGRDMASARTQCSLCGARTTAYVTDFETEALGEKHGRSFYGLTYNAPLCSRCADNVELAGAERLYWEVAETYSTPERTV